MLENLGSVQAQISLTRLTHNLSVIKKAVGPDVSIMAVVKADAYGHGLVLIIKHLWSQSVNQFAVARLEEAIVVRQSLPKAKILILSPIAPEHFDIALSNHLALTVTEEDHLKILSKQGKKAKIHLKVDTGLNRAGVEQGDVLDFAKLARSLPNIELEGIFTHFANAATDHAFTTKQLGEFQKVITILKNNQLLPKLIHAAATTAIFNYPKSHFNLVRPGLSLYGHFPDKEKNFGLKPILSLYTRINRLHQILRGETVGYDRTFKAKNNLSVATLSIGYADGLRRTPKPWPHVSVYRQIAPIIGRISMDQSVLDISDIKPKPNLKTKVLVLDNKTEGPFSLKSIAEKIGTSPYEVLTGLSPDRISRRGVPAPTCPAVQEFKQKPHAVQASWSSAMPIPKSATPGGIPPRPHEYGFLRDSEPQKK